MLWERIPEVQGLDRANTYYELSARIYARGQYDEALALAETARDIYAVYLRISWFIQCQTYLISSHLEFLDRSHLLFFLS